MSFQRRSILFLMLFFTSCSFAKQWRASYVRIVPESGTDTSGGGFVYGSQGVVKAQLELLDSDYDLVVAIPVRVRIGGVGLSVYGLLSENFRLNLSGFNNKKIKYLTGGFYGAKAGIGLYAFGRLGGFVNGYGVRLGQANAATGYGADIALSRIYVELHSNYLHYADDTVVLE